MSISPWISRARMLCACACEPGPQPKFDFATLPADTRGTAARRITGAFWNFESVRTRRAPLVDGRRAAGRWNLPTSVMAGILEHARRVQLGASRPRRQIMIPRILVPRMPGRSRPPPTGRADAAQMTRTRTRARWSPRICLDRAGPAHLHSAHLPLDVLAARVVVPRRHAVDSAGRTSVDARLRVVDHPGLARRRAQGCARGDELTPSSWVAHQDLPEVLEPDVLTTGEVHLMNRPVAERASAWNGVARVASIAFHCLLLFLLLFQPGVAPSQQVAEAEIDRQTHSYLYLPAGRSRRAAGACRQATAERADANRSARAAKSSAMPPSPPPSAGSISARPYGRARYAAWNPPPRAAPEPAPRPSQPHPQGSGLTAGKHF